MYIINLNKMLNGAKISWEDCEPSIDTVWHNIEQIDPLMKLDLMMMVMYSYYHINNNKKSPRDLEIELRKHNLNHVGLIAVEWDKQDHYKKLVNNSSGIIIKKKYIHLYEGKKNPTKIEDVDPNHISKHVICVSCRPIKYVIEETLTHSSSLEENLEKLEEAGEFVLFNESDYISDGVLDDVLDSDDIKINVSNTNSKIQHEIMKIKIGSMNQLPGRKKLMRK